MIPTFYLSQSRISNYMLKTSIQVCEIEFFLVTGQHDVRVRHLPDRGGDLVVDWAVAQQAQESRKSSQSFRECKSWMKMLR
jgi:hypothetical protein